MPLNAPDGVVHRVATTKCKIARGNAGPPSAAMRRSRARDGYGCAQAANRVITCAPPKARRRMLPQHRKTGLVGSRGEGAADGPAEAIQARGFARRAGTNQIKPIKPLRPHRLKASRCRARKKLKQAAINDRPGHAADSRRQGWRTEQVVRRKHHGIDPAEFRRSSACSAGRSSARRRADLRLDDGEALHQYDTR